MASGPALALDDAELEALLSAAVLRGHRVDSEGEQRAVAAFRAARDSGAHRAARTRHRDDWRPRERRLALSVRTTLSLFLASLTLGGAAFAAIGSSGSSDESDDKGGPTPSNSALDRPTAEPSSAGSAAEKPGHPDTAQDTEARCRAYDQVKGQGKALDATAWQRLVTAAGGEDKVAAYCAEQLARAATSRPSQAATPGGGAAGATNGADNADSGADNAQSGADNAESGAGNAESGAGNAESGADNAESGADNGAGGDQGDQADNAPESGKKN
ncbi:hypothetical protein IM697_39495 [Streptomyces ferrugineus]|uniref:Uncharacterized protein n=1 Tax=Streptomyces ferrugineus TaxID=1413221 RepID=A0A7M2SID8_9ACTN|nr:hypothetical protein [Streptomyces ferrugineus]QOV36054.1 hypothetical protein IM697_39495 [Streptomyces ferrugineus]